MSKESKGPKNVNSPQTMRRSFTVHLAAQQWQLIRRHMHSNAFSTTFALNLALFALQLSYRLLLHSWHPGISGIRNSSCYLENRNSHIFGHGKVQKGAMTNVCSKLQTAQPLGLSGRPVQKPNIAQMLVTRNVVLLVASGQPAPAQTLC